MFERISNYVKSIRREFTILLVVVPFIGLFLAYVYEIIFFQTLGIPVRMLFESGDIVRASIFVILPLAGIVIAVLAGAFIFGSTKEATKAEITSQIEEYPKPSKLLQLLKLLFKLLAVLTASSVLSIYLLTGYFAGPAIMVLLILVEVLFIEYLGKTDIFDDFPIEAYVLTMLLIVLTIGFSIFGVFKASRINSGKTESLPTVFISGENSDVFENLRLVRKFSAGILTVSDSKIYYYYKWDKVEYIEFNQSLERWSGIPCELFNYCKYSEMIGEELTN